MIKKMYTGIHPSLIQLITLCISFLSIWLSVVHAMFSFLSTKRHGGEALRPPSQPPSSFLHIIISKIYFHPSTYHSINQSNYLSVCFSLYVWIQIRLSTPPIAHISFSRDYIFFSIGFSTFLTILIFLFTILYVSHFRIEFTIFLCRILFLSP